MRRATITEVTVMPYDYMAVATCPWCHERNQWPSQYGDRPGVYYCQCPECSWIYTVRLTRRWVDLVDKHRDQPFTVLREAT